MREHGVLEPLVVRRRPGTETDFEIIAGERRWRAAQRASLREVLVVVRDVSARDAYELALIENVQRADLDAIEFAEALDRLLKEHALHAGDARPARRQGSLDDRERAPVAAACRSRCAKRVVNGELSEGHARASARLAERRRARLRSRRRWSAGAQRATDRSARSLGEDCEDSRGVGKEAGPRR